MKNLLVIFVALGVIAGVLLVKKGEEIEYLLDTYNQNTYIQKQHGMDVKRIKDIIEIADYVEEYNDITGGYPLVGTKDAPVYVRITTEQQQIDADSFGGPPFKHYTISVDEFTGILEDGLNREITLPRDPQEVVDKNQRPNFYMYMVKEGVYDLSTHLHHPQSFTYRIKDDWHIFSLSNKANEGRVIWTYPDIMEQDDFLDIIYD